MDNKKHLSEQEIAKCSEAISNGTFKQLNKYYIDHIAECCECANEVTMVSSILEAELVLVSELDQNKNIKKGNKRKLIYLWSSAAALVVLMAVPFLISKNTTQPVAQNLAQNKPAESCSEIDTTNNIVQSKNTLNKPAVQPQKNPKKKPQIIETKKQTLLAYAPNEHLDRLTERFASANMRGENIEISSPNSFESKVGEIVLVWENPNQQSLIVECFNNKGEKISEAKTTEAQYKANEITSKGLYYWKLINEDFDLLFCGKIIVK